MFQLMEHFGIHMLHAQQLSQEITARLQKHICMVTLCIIYSPIVLMLSC